MYDRVEYDEIKNGDIEYENMDIDDKTTRINIHNLKGKRNKKMKFMVLLLYIVLISVVIFLSVTLVKLNDKINTLDKKMNDSLAGYTIEQKNEELKKISDENNEAELVIINYDNEIKELENNITNITSSNEQLTNDLTAKQNELNSKKDTYNNLKNEYARLSTHIIQNVATYNQHSGYPSGCEAVALYILLKYHNVNVSIDSIVDNLPKGKIPYDVDGVLHGGDPNYEFLGDPRSSSGWGIYDQGLANTANHFKSNIVNGTGMDFNRIRELIKANRPVIVWTSINLTSPYVSKSWISDRTGETITWKKNNHTVVVIGYTDSSVVISDPYDGKIKYWNKQKFINVYSFMGRRALYY